ncbi:MAG: malic enzyme-like NAD(P)-binding protein [Gammaproteobacteria bacterium]
MADDIVQHALDYHAKPTPGKLGVALTKPAQTQRDLSLAYSPGVAYPVLEIAKSPENAYKYTNKGNLIAVISNGSAILGLGNLGALASKPVMEGKAVLFKRFADIDVFDIEVNCNTIDAFVETVANIAPTFGGINLEDIKAPECFEIESLLANRLDIPVFHDDQHGTAMIIAAGLLNALDIQKKKLSESVIVCVGAGAAGIASMHLLIKMGAKRDNIFMIDSQGVIHSERDNINLYKAEFAHKTKKRTLEDAIKGADVFIGVSQPDLLTEAMLKSMAKNPVVFALSNPDPEIKPELAHSIRNDVIVATGRSDYPNQVNNVLGFPYIFRGALDARAKHITDAMKHAGVEALRKIAHEPVPQEVLDAYPNEKSLSFGRDYILPKPMDPRLRDIVSKAVADAAD